MISQSKTLVISSSDFLPKNVPDISLPSGPKKDPPAIPEPVSPQPPEEVNVKSLSKSYSKELPEIEASGKFKVNTGESRSCDSEVAP